MRYTQEADPLDEPYLPEILSSMPGDAMLIDSDEDGPLAHQAGHTCSDRVLIKPPKTTCYMAVASLKDTSRSWKEVLACKLLSLARKHRKCTPPTSRMRLDQQKLAGSEPAVLQSKKIPVDSGEVVLVTATGAEGVLDTGASRTVVGSQRVKEVLQGLDAKCRAGVRKITSGINFRFGNSGTLQSKYALLVPTDQSSWIRVEVIPGNTPLLVSNRLLRELDAIIHVRKGYLQLPDRIVPMRLDERGLSIVDLSVLMQSVGEHCLQVTATNPEQQQPTATPVFTQPGDQQQPTAIAQHSLSPAPCQHAGSEPQRRPQAPGDHGMLGGSHQPRRALERCRGPRPRRGPDQLAALPDDGLCAPAKCELIERMGAGTPAVGQAQSPVFRDGLPQRHAVCSLRGPENHANERVGALLPKFRHREVQSDC